MPKDRAEIGSTVALSTKLEEDFVSPLTAVRGALEILRDFPDLTYTDRERFIATALEECARLERGIDHLATTVYAAGQRSTEGRGLAGETADSSVYASRIKILNEHETIDLDFSHFEFSSSTIVNEFYDALDKLVRASGRSWYFAVNYQGCSIWPEAWVAFAHRGKQANVSYSLGTVRYLDGAAPGNEAAHDPQSETRDTATFNSRDEALERIAELRRMAAGG